MSQGYSLRLRDLNRRAPSKVCVKHNVPVTVVAQRMGVTRQTVYNWFAGTTNPQPALTSLVESYIAQFS